jgi:calcium permeable stress-gated cation channel
VVTKESIYFIGLRQALFLSSLHAQRLSSRTVLFLSIPKEHLSEQSLRQIFGSHVRKIWIVPDYTKLEDSVDERDKLWNKLEAGEQKLITNANKNAIKKAKKGNNEPVNPAAILDNKKERPTHRLKFLVGKKVDTIDYGRTQLPKLGGDIDRMQQDFFDGKAKATPAAFIEFSSQAAAQEAMQFTAKDKKTQFAPRLIGVDPDEVIWKNLAVSNASRKIKMAVATAAITLLTIFWAIPVTFVGALTNINYLTNEVPFLSFINDIPDVILGAVTGLLPVILLAVLMALVPILCGLLAKFAGAPTLSAVEMKVQSWYFVFQVIQVFLVTTFASGAAAVASQIVSDPSIAVSLLAENLPKASNFYISYFVLQGLMVFALTLLNIVPFLMINVLGKFLDKTPRKQYNRWMTLAGLGWGSVYPKFTNLGVIALSYSCIAPLVLGFATIGFALIYLGFRYNFLFVFGMKADMKGENYPKALQQLLVGAYLSTMCLIGLFAIRTADYRAAIGPLVISVVFLIVLIVAQVVIHIGLGPLKSQIPLSLLAENRESTLMSSDPEIAEKEGQTGEAGIWRPTVDLNKAKGNFLTRKFEGMIDKARFKAQSLLSDTQAREKPSYLPEDLQNAYMHPALAAQRKPFVWLARDNLGLSKVLVDGNRKAGVDSTDDGAWLNEQGKVEWNTDQPTKAPIYEEARIW